MEVEMKSADYGAVTPQCLHGRSSISSIDSDDVSLTSFGVIEEQQSQQDDLLLPSSNNNNKKSPIISENEDEGAHMTDLSDSASDTGSNGGGKDSGCEVTPDPESSEPPFTPPNDELAEKIVQQVEFYFSDANITKDAFLLKHVKRNKEGYVSLKLISSFKRVKHITKDWRVVAYALKKSTRLQINEAGTKLRRLEALPQYDETTPSRTVVAVNMPIEKPTIENVAELFRSCGELALIRILRPGNPIPADVRQFINKNPLLAGLVCALVEFVHSESARNALQMAKEHAELSVYELNCVPHPERKKKSATKKTRKMMDFDLGGSQSTTCPSSSEAEDRMRFEPRLKTRRGSANYPPRCTEPAAWLQRRLSASSTEASFMYLPRRLSYGSRDSSDSSLFIPRRISTGGSSTASSCYDYHQQNMNYINRRISNCSVSSESSSALGNNNNGANKSRSNSLAFQNENVVRLPKGPDGSRGFRQRSSLGTIYS